MVAPRSTRSPGCGARASTMASKGAWTGVSVALRHWPVPSAARSKVCRESGAVTTRARAGCAASSSAAEWWPQPAASSPAKSRAGTTECARLILPPDLGVEDREPQLGARLLEPSARVFEQPARVQQLEHRGGAREVEALDALHVLRGLDHRALVRDPAARRQRPARQQVERLLPPAAPRRFGARFRGVQRRLARR